MGSEVNDIQYQRHSGHHPGLNLPNRQDRRGQSQSRTPQNAMIA